jgi:hypothetical protein
MLFDMLFSIRIWFEQLILRRDYSVEPADIEDVTAEYPLEYIEKLEKLAEEAERQIASGELKPMTVEELAAKHGFKRSWWRGWVAVKT